MILVGQERERQRVLCLERLVTLRPLPADAQHHSVLVLDDCELVAEAARLRRTSWRVVARVEEKNDTFAAKIGQRDRIPVLVRERELGRRVANLQRLHAAISFRRPS